jgi:hypothetical protein
MFGSEKLTEKWSPVLDAEAAAPIKDNYRKAVTAALLENTEKALQEQRAQSGFMTETTNLTTGVDNFDPVLISLVRRAMPNLIAYDIAGVQPMSGPTGLIFAMKSEYTSQGGTEALVDEANTAFSGTGSHGGNSSSLDPAFGNDATSDVDDDPSTPDATDETVDFDAAFGIGTGIDTDTAEASSAFAEMAFSIDRTSVTAKTRQLKAEYTMELAQDLKAVHGLDAETELANILSAEILAEVNREVIRTINVKAKAAAEQSSGVVGTGASNAANAKGFFDLDATDGRWSVEKYKSLIMKIELEANAIAKDTRRGKGNFVICSSDVASALAAAGLLDYTPALSTNLNVDDTGNTFAGVLNGRMKVYIDPYATVNYVTVGYRGSNPYDAGLFYCPYVPLTMVKAVGENTFQPKIGFKTRYGMVANPFVDQTGGIGDNRTNSYFRIFGVQNVITNAA